MHLIRRQRINCLLLVAIIIATLLLIISLNPVNAEKLILGEYGDPLLQIKPAQTVLINGTGIFLTTGDSWEFYQGYRINLKSVNIERKKAWVRLFNEDELVKEQIVSEGEMFIYTKEDGAEIINLTLDTIYINPGGELVTFKPVYQYRDYDLPEPIIEDEEETANLTDENDPDPDTSAVQANGFTLVQTVAVTGFLFAVKRVIRK